MSIALDPASHPVRLFVRGEQSRCVLGVELVTGDEVFRNVPGLVVAGAAP